MMKQLEKYILTGAWVIGVILAGSDGGPLSPLINLTGVLLVGLSSWFIHARASLSEVPLQKGSMGVGGREDIPFFYEIDSSNMVWTGQGRVRLEPARCTTIIDPKWRS